MEGKEPLEPDRYYHIYNHAVGKENLFVKDENYLFFLKKYKQYISPIADTFAYCLMPNHFHLATRIKPVHDLLGALQGLISPDRVQNPVRAGNAVPNPVRAYEMNDFISKQFSNLFNSYAQAFNKQQARKGSLFERPFERKLITSDEYFRNLIHYIHFNPVHHGFVNDLRDWKYTSFESFFSSKATSIKRDEVIEWFHDKENFQAFHKREIDEKMALELEFI